MANNLPLSSLKDFRFAVPPLDEATKIAQRIDIETAVIDRRVEDLEAEILLLREYRTRLTADVVTGRLDVREAAARIPDGTVVDLNDALADVVDESEQTNEELEA